jgi:UDP:flavonoid glycosyltransferase YjiC (YdhE family)
MNENAARVAWAGAGLRLPRRFISPRPLRHAVEHALSEPSVRARARELASWVSTQEAGTRAAQLVEGLADPLARDQVGKSDSRLIRRA